MKWAMLLASILMIMTGCRINDAMPAADGGVQPPASETAPSGTTQGADVTEEKLPETEEIAEMNENPIMLEVNGYTLTVELADNDPARELAALIKEAPLTLELKEYGSFEKVGALPQSLPTDDRRVTAQPGDIMLYQGDQVTIFYGTNTWSYTPLGRIEGADKALKEIFGAGNITVVLYSC